MNDLNNTLELFEKELHDEIERQISENTEFLKSEHSKPRNMILGVWQTILRKIMYKLKVRVQVYWSDKLLFEYEIPKD